MFSASLLSMMVHSLPGEALRAFLGVPPIAPFLPEFGEVEEGAPYLSQRIPGPTKLQERFQRALDAFSGEWPRLPFVGRASAESYPGLAETLKASATGDPDRGFLWGRPPLDALITRYVNFGHLPAREEHLDLGTPVREAGVADATSMCEELLAHTPEPGTALVRAGIIDTGEVKPAGTTGAPRTFGGKLHHAVMHSPKGPVDLSIHAEEVLHVLLDRLKEKGTLDKTTVSMALMLAPMPDEVRKSMGCFAQHCAPEMLTAVRAMEAHLKSDQLPAVVNISLGTHVGPHNGASELESYISGTMFRPCERFPFAAAGNEGERGIAAQLDLLRDQTDYLKLLVGQHCTELLVEFWWDDAGPADVEVKASVQGSGFSPAVVVIGSATQATLEIAVSRGPMNLLTLCQAKSHGTMSCIAFAAKRPASAAAFSVAFDVTAKSSHTAVHTWVVICDAEQETRFETNSPWGTVSVPASDPRVVSVAGFNQAENQMMRESSRGPASRYSPAAPTHSPAMAHLAHYDRSGVTNYATSYASPRAAADATEALYDPRRCVNCTETTKLIEETYGSGSVAPTWNPRHGYRRQAK
jgi:hypothetical protein